MAQVLREAQEVSNLLALISGEVPRFHGGSLWHSYTGTSPGALIPLKYVWYMTLCKHALSFRSTGGKGLPVRQYSLIA